MPDLIWRAVFVIVSSVAITIAVTVAVVVSTAAATAAATTAVNLLGLAVRSESVSEDRGILFLRDAPFTS